ncbi:major facilitator superfamily domain-containing protein [Trametes maxima]|nr:major facilitator superfamily domain-containing protein [Trametes maxima]
MSFAHRNRSVEVKTSEVTTVVRDIEHADVLDDPREWSKRRKLIIVATVSAASLINGLSGNIYNPAIAQIEEQLHTSSGLVSLSLSLFILIQGGVGPFLWSALSEFWGRKRVYLLATALCVLGCIMAALSENIGVLIGMRCIQGLGAVTALGAATLADIYEPSQRGTMMDTFSAPLLGPSLGPILGGVLTQAFDWRATFWFLAIFSGICFLSFIPFKDTFRRERSLVYQAALRRRLGLQNFKESEKSSVSQDAGMPREGSAPKLEPTVVAKPRNSGVAASPEFDIEEQQAAQSGVGAAPARDVKLTLADVNPVKPILYVLRRMNNLTIAATSGIIFAFTYSITYTCSRTLANRYNYGALNIGLVLLAFGIGSVLGSVIGGRYSDYIFKKFKTRNGGMNYPEMRLLSTMIPMLLLPPSVIAYGWICERRIHVAAICVTLFLSGFLSICIYSSTLAYVVDANVGRSSSAVATNSAQSPTD